jgi:Na+-translocating ferredoxin:NAD+ oxidoreductase RNF subunit RnfB
MKAYLRLAVLGDSAAMMLGMRFVALLLSAAISFGLNATAYAQAVKVVGPAAQCVFVTFNGCFTVQNSCPYRVRVHAGNVFTLINPGGSWVPIAPFSTNQCLTAFVGVFSANQE